jgi:hypothetical protein
MGFDAILSETPTFPVSPSISPIQNCLQAVKDRADIFVLIVGGRYGSQGESGKSVTNLEYLEAKAKGVPVYVFVSKQILNILPVWQANKSGNYSGIVDTPKLFEFVEQLRSSKDHWVYEFEEVQHIITTLRSQLAILLMEGLALREKFQSLRLPASLVELRGKSLKLLLEQPTAWEYSLLSSVMADEMELDNELKWDVKFGLKLQESKNLNHPILVCDWLTQKMSEIMGLIESFGTLMNSAAQESFGPLGSPGNPEQIVYVARRLAQIRKALLHWKLAFNNADVPVECERLLSLVSSAANDAIEKVEGIPKHIDKEISLALSAVQRGEKYEANIMLKLDEPPHMKEIQEEFERLSNISDL